MKRGTAVRLEMKFEGRRELLFGTVVEVQGREVVVQLDSGRRVTAFASQVCEVGK